jgi:ribosomal protein S27E
MSSIAAEPEDEALAIDRMLDDGAPVDPWPPVRRSRWSPVHLQDELPAAERAAQRRAARRLFRVYCVACGRSTDVHIVPARPARCVHCGGTMLAEMTAD